VLSQNQLSVVDDDLYDWVAQWKWIAHRSKQRWYAVRTVPSDTSPSGTTTLKLHRVIWEQVRGSIPASAQIDHISGDGLDNRMDNLRLASNAQNQRNRGPNRNNPSGWKGVGWDKRDERWRVQIMLDGSMRHLGTFERKIIGALHYDQAAIESFDEFAYLNFPNLSRMIADGRINLHLDGQGARFQVR
jgi:HNH endonuclease